jgi:hypothetical protein
MADGAPNPFRFNLPTPPREFLGRSADVQKIADELCSWRGDSHAVIGGRRFGKSSLLITLEHALRARWEQRQGGGPRVLPVRFSIQDIVPLSSPDDFFRFAIEQICLVFEEIAKEAAGAALGPLLARGEGPARPRAILREFEEVVLKIATASGTPLRVALLVDEMDAALDSAAVGALFGNLRSLVSTGRVSDHVRLVAAGVGRFRELDGRDSPLFNVLTPLFLEPFDEPSARALIARAEGLDASVAEALIGAAGGHPFILQFLLHHLFRRGIASVTKVVLEDTVLKFMQDRRPDLAGWWQAVGSEGQTAYSVLAKTSRWTSVGEVARALGRASARVKRGLEALWFHGLVQQRDGHREYSVGGELFRDWYAQQDAPARPTADGELLPQVWVRQIHRAAVDVGLTACRDVLLSGMQPGLAADLPMARNPSSQLLSDLQVLNRIMPARDRASPLEIWLHSALELSRVRDEAQTFREALDELGAL